MRVKIAILDKDTAFMGILSNTFTRFYQKETELFMFTDPSKALESAVNGTVNILLAAPETEFDASAMPESCAFAWFIRDSANRPADDKAAIHKYQKADAIYRQILGLVSDKVNVITIGANGTKKAKLVLFAPVSGGSGATTISTAYALRMARKGTRVLWLSLENYGTGEVLLGENGVNCMDDVIFSLKDKSAGLSMKLESAITRRDNGIYYLYPTKIARYMLELNGPEIEKMMTELLTGEQYDLVVVDSDFSLGETMWGLYRLADTVVWTAEGTANSNVKLKRSYELLKMLAYRGTTAAEKSIPEKVRIMYNKFSNKVCKEVTELAGAKIGGCPRIDHATEAMVLDYVSNQDYLDNI